MDDITRRGETVWTEIEAEISRRNAPGYDRAADPAATCSELRTLSDS